MRRRGSSVIRPHCSDNACGYGSDTFGATHSSCASLWLRWTLEVFIPCPILLHVWLYISLFLLIGSHACTHLHNFGFQHQCVKRNRCFSKHFLIEELNLSTTADRLFICTMYVLIKTSNHVINWFSMTGEKPDLMIHVCLVSHTWHTRPQSDQIRSKFMLLVKTKICEETIPELCRGEIVTQVLQKYTSAMLVLYKYMEAEIHFGSYFIKKWTMQIIPRTDQCNSRGQR